MFFALALTFIECLLVASDGTVEIPILHVTGDDPSRHDSTQERWSPVQSVEKILLAVRGMLVHPFEENIANPQADVRFFFFFKECFYLEWNATISNSFPNLSGMLHIATVLFSNESVFFVCPQYRTC
jgi:hypothetical protein